MTFFADLDWWQLVIGVVLSGCFGAWLSEYLRRRRQPTGDYQLWIEVVPRRLLSRHAEQVRHQLTVQTSGEDLADPHLIDLYFWYAGEKDLRPDAFLEERAFIIDLNCRAPHVERITSKGELSNVKFDSAKNSARLVVKPGLVRTGDAAHYRLITEARPQLSFDNPVADLSHYILSSEKWGRTPRRRKLRAWKWVYFTIGTLVSAGAITWMALDGGFFERAIQAIVAFIATVGLITAGMVFWEAADRLDRRTRRAQRIAEKSLNTRIPDMSDIAAEELRRS